MVERAFILITTSLTPYVPLYPSFPTGRQMAMAASNAEGFRHYREAVGGPRALFGNAEARPAALPSGGEGGERLAGAQQQGAAAAGGKKRGKASATAAAAASGGQLVSKRSKGGGGAGGGAKAGASGGGGSRGQAKLFSMEQLLKPISKK